MNTLIDNLYYPTLSDISYPSLDIKNNYIKKQPEVSMQNKINIYPSLSEHTQDSNLNKRTKAPILPKINLYPNLDEYKQNNHPNKQRETADGYEININRRVEKQVNSNQINQQKENSFNSNATIYPSVESYTKNNHINKPLEPSVEPKANTKPNVNQHIRNNNEKICLEKIFLANKKVSRRNRKVTPYNCIPQPLGLKNQGLYCWLNSSLKLLITMLDIEDIRLIRTVVSKNPNSSINKVRNIFTNMWSIYHNFNGNHRMLAENKLELYKKELIEQLQKFVREGSIESGGLREYFLPENPNDRQDANLFLMEMQIILCADNPTHKLKSCTYIEAIYTDKTMRKQIIRKASETPALIINLVSPNKVDSLNKYIELMGAKEANTYYWSATELLEQGITTTNLNDTPIKGNKFEVVEVDLANLDNFVIYFSLPNLDPSTIKSSHNKIIQLILSDNFPNDYINTYDSNNITKQYDLLITAKAIICFTGTGYATHYVCLTIEGDKIMLHNDNNIIPLNKYLHVDEKYDLTRQLANFFIQYNFTPYSILYTTRK